jgi:hypothetical protein
VPRATRSAWPGRQFGSRADAPFLRQRWVQSRVTAEAEFALLRTRGCLRGRCAGRVSVLSANCRMIKYPRQDEDEQTGEETQADNAPRTQR